MDRNRHDGRVVIVTGAGSGIGRATAVRLAREGGLVVGCDLTAAIVSETADEIAAHGGVSTMTVADVTRQSDIDELVRLTVDTYGRVDAVANVAGVMDWFLPAHEVDDDTWTRVMAVNVEGPMRLTRAVLPGMIERGNGSVVNIASEAGLRGAAGGFAYTTAKHAVLGQTRSVAWTYREAGVRCNAVCPGAVATNLGTSAQPRSEWGVDRLKPVLRLRGPSVDPDQLAATVSWLTSDEATNISGAILAADGGWLAG
jgi:NAD(P)-dependent dehydrogenase (short-subunit alcohol dehydrogenase family)